MYTSGTVKRQKVTRDVSRAAEVSENFHGINRIEYKSDSPFNSEDQLYYRYYNATERIHGRPMEDWLRPSIFLGQAFTPYPGCVQRPWCESNQTIENYKKSIRAMFELCIKLGIKFWSGYDLDIAPEFESFEESQTNFDQVVELINEYQQKTGIRPLWFGVDFKNQNRYKNGAATNSDANIVTYAGYQAKRGLDAAYKLNAESFLFNGEQEGYENIMNSDLHKEIKHYSRFLKMIVDQRDKIGYRGMLLMQSNYKGIKHQKYNSDLFSSLTLLKHYNYDRYFKMNVNTGHEFYMSNVYGSLGCVDIKGNSLMDISNATLLLRTIIENGGLAPGGLTFYLPNNIGYCEPRELAEGYVAAIDFYAKALRLAVKLVNDSQINKSIQMRYLNFSTGWGAKFMGPDASLEECEEYAKKLHETNLLTNSTKSDHWSVVLNRYIDAPLK